MRDYLVKQGFKSVGKYLGNNFIVEVDKIDKPIMMNLRRVVNLWNKGNVRMIKFFQKKTPYKERLN
jgi:hypothetical protein